MEMNFMGSKSTVKQVLVVAIAIIALLALFFAVSVRKIGTTNGPDVAPTTAPAAVSEDGSQLTLQPDEEGEWYAYKSDGMIDWNFSGLVTNESGTWYVKDGKVDFENNGTYIDSDGTEYNLEGGKVS